MAQQLLQRNGTHLSMSGESSVARGPLADAIGQDGEGEAMEDILNGKFEGDMEEMDEATASSEMRSSSRY